MLDQHNTLKHQTPAFPEVMQSSRLIPEHGVRNHATYLSSHISFTSPELPLTGKKKKKKVSGSLDSKVSHPDTHQQRNFRVLTVSAHSKAQHKHLQWLYTTEGKHIYVL